MTSKSTEAIKQPPKNESKVTSYNEFIRRFYPDPEKPQLAKVDSSQKAKLDARCLFSR
jgi:hypothetical protein